MTVFISSMFFVYTDALTVTALQERERERESERERNDSNTSQEVTIALQNKRRG